MRKFRQKYYDLFSCVYDRFIAMHSSGKQGSIKEFFVEKTGIRSGGKVLDICTGTGSLLSYLKERTGDEGMVVGLDFSKGMLLVAAGKTSGTKGVWLVQADVAALPFKKNVFHAATCAHAFYELHEKDQRNCLMEIRRVLAQGRPFAMMEHDVPKKPLIRFLFYIRLMSMGLSKAMRILRNERRMLEKYFSRVEKFNTDTGRSKIYVCR